MLERSDKREGLNKDARLGYQSVHYLVRLNDRRLVLPEYRQFEGRVAKVRTILQHAWAEIEHDIQYKSVEILPNEIRRLFLALAGMLEIGDREFQELSDSHGRIRDEARSAVAANQLKGVEITPDALKAFLDKNLGSDGRMRDWVYAWESDALRTLGFSSLEQVADAISGLDDDLISRSACGSRQGQINRFDELVRVAMGSNFAELHPFNVSSPDWWRSQHKRILASHKRNGIKVGSYRPPSS